MLSAKQFDVYVKQGYENIALVEHIDISRMLLPIDIYENFSEQNYSFLYESYGKKNTNHFATLCLGATDIFRISNYQALHFYQEQLVCQTLTREPLDWIEAYIIKKHKKYLLPPEEDLDFLLNNQLFYGGLVGYFGFETIGYHVKKLAKGLFLNNKFDMDDIFLWCPESFLIFDKRRSLITCVVYSQKGNYEQTARTVLDLCEKIKAITPPHIRMRKNISSSPIDKGTVTDQSRFEKIVKRVIEYIYQGDAMQVVPSHVSSFPFPKEKATELYRQLLRISPSPHMYLLRMQDTFIVGASPEILALIQGNKVTVRPLAGTRLRGLSIKEDEENANSLINDTKEIAEHLMLIDLVRNDLGKIAKTGSVTVTEKMVIEKYAKVMHLSSTVVAERTTDKILDILQVIHPAGTLSGAPKVRAVEIIQELEKTKRCVYGGFIALLGFDFNVQSCIAIRTGVIKDNRLYIQAGAGVVADSVPTKEWQEVCNKKSALIVAANCALESG